MQKNPKMTTCKTCGKEVATNAKTCPTCGAKIGKPFWKKWWFWLIVVVFVLGVAGGASSDTDSSEPQEPTEQVEEKVDAPKQEDSIPEISGEFKAALNSAKTYANTMHMSKEAIYDQLTSEYDKFPEDAARYAVDNVEADWNKNALESAKVYAESMDMSSSAIYDQLTSQFDQFTPEQAQYAVDHLYD